MRRERLPGGGEHRICGRQQYFALESNDLGSEHGVSYRSATYEDVDAGSIAYGVAQCPDGTVRTGGGGAVDGPTSEAWISDSGPEFLNDADVPPKPRQAWTTGITNGAGAAKDVTGDAICAKPKLLRFAKHRKGTTVQDEPFKVKARCPRGTDLVGGGFDSEGNMDQTLISAPFDGGDGDGRPDDGWTARILASQDSRHVRVRVICSDRLDLAYRTETDTGDGTISAEAICPPGSVLTGGGATLSGDEGGFPHDSEPIDFGDVDTVPGDGWNGVAFAAADRTITTTVICKG